MLTWARLSTSSSAAWGVDGAQVKEVVLQAPHNPESSKRKSASWALSETIALIFRVRPILGSHRSHGSHYLHARITPDIGRRTF
jgi:hypothetical protein